MGAHYSGDVPTTIHWSAIFKVVLLTAVVAAALWWLVMAGGAELGSVVTDWFRRL
jgi:hypothetical protein